MDAAAELTAVRKKMTEMHKEQKDLDIAEDAQSDVVGQKKDAVRFVLPIHQSFNRVG
jgi:hypothetical protein